MKTYFRKSRSRSRSKGGSKSISKNDNAMVSTKLMIEFMTLYNNRNKGILSSDEVFSKRDITRLSDVEYLEGISESVKHGFSILELKGLLHINDHSHSKPMKQFIQIVSVIYEDKIDTDEFLKYLKLLFTPHAEPGKIEYLNGGVNGKKMLEFIFKVARLYGLYLMVTYMTRSLHHRTEVSRTANAIVELMTTSNCPVPELSPALAYLVDNNWISESEQRILIAAKMTDLALSGGCNPLQSQIEHILFTDDAPEPMRQEMMSALVPVSYELTVGPGDSLAANSVSTKVKSIRETHSLSEFETYGLIIKFDENEFYAQLKQYELVSESKDKYAQVVNIKKATSALDVLNYAYGGIKGQVTEYWSDVTQFKMLNPIPMTDAWKEMKYTAKKKMMDYKHLVDKGMLTMETANDEMWAWIKHASIIFVLTKAGICAGVSFLIWMGKEIHGWRRGETEHLALEYDGGCNKRSRLKSRGGTKTKKLRKKV